MAARVLVTAGCWLLAVGLQAFAADSGEWMPFGPLAVLAARAHGGAFVWTVFGLREARDGKR